MGSAPLFPDHAWGMVLLGAVIVNVYYFFDVVDGNIARLSGKGSNFGQFSENNLYIAAMALVPVVLGFVLYFLADDAVLAMLDWPPVMAIVLGAGVGVFRLLRRLLLESAAQLAGVSTASLLPAGGRDSRSPVAAAVAIVNSSALPLLIVVALSGAPMLWLMLYFLLSGASVAYMALKARRVLSKLNGTASARIATK